MNSSLSPPVGGREVGREGREGGRNVVVGTYIYIYIYIYIFPSTDCKEWIISFQPVIRTVRIEFNKQSEKTATTTTMMMMMMMMVTMTMTMTMMTTTVLMMMMMRGDRWHYNMYVSQ